MTMAIREIIKLPHPTLRRKAVKVKQFDKDLHKLIEDMIETMRDEPGVGLAAPQVNISQRVIVVEYPLDDSDPEATPTLFEVVNPVIKYLSDEKEMGIEGCLSVPNIMGSVERALNIQISGQNRKGKKITIEAQGWLARVFQHEIDHLNGVLFVDLAETLYRPEEFPEGKEV